MIHLIYIHKNLQNGRTLPLLSFDIEKSSKFGVIWDEVIIFKMSSIIIISIQVNHVPLSLIWVSTSWKYINVFYETGVI